MAFATSFIYEAIDKMTPVLKEMEERSKKLETALKDAMKNPGKDAKFFEDALKDAATKPVPKIKRLNEKLKDTSKNIKKMSKSLKDVGGNMSTFVTAPVLGGFAAMILAGGSYEDSLASLSSITGLQGTALKSLSNEILTTSKNFGIGASDIAGGMEGKWQLPTPSLMAKDMVLMGLGDVLRTAAGRA